MPKRPRIRRRVLTPGSAARINGFRPDPSLRAKRSNPDLGCAFCGSVWIASLSLTRKRRKAFNALKSLDAELKSAVSFPHE
jgi:hypothetical protein